MALVQCMCLCMHMCVGDSVGEVGASAEVVENMASSVHKCANAYPTSDVCMCVSASV